MLFIKLMKPIMHHLRSNGYLSVIYLDDFLILGHSYEKCRTNMKNSISLLESLGILINYNKSSLIPQNICVYLGFEDNSINMTISIPDNKRERLISMLINFS